MSDVGEALRAAVAEHGAPLSIRTGIATIQRDGVALHVVSSVIVLTDGWEMMLSWREFLDPVDAAICARTRSKQIRKLLRPKN